MRHAAWQAARHSARRAAASIVLGCAVLLAACGGGASGASDAGASSDDFRPLAVGDTVPAYTAVTLAGNSVRIGASARAPVTLVNVWATWCTSCREEFDELESLQRAYAPRGLRVVAVSVDEQGMAPRVERFAQSRGATFAVAHDPAGAIEKQWQVVGVPSTYLLAPDGRLLWSHVGELDDAEAKQAVERALCGEGSVDRCQQ